jgi:hypothetical protein
MEFVINLAKELLLAWRQGGKRLRALVIVGAILGGLAFFMNLAAHFVAYDARLLDGLSSILGVAAGSVALIIYAYRRSVEEAQNDKRVEQAETRVRDNPNQPQAAWDLARLKLESYLNRNLAQVRSIFWLTAFVMFSFVGYGSYEAVNNAADFKAATLTTVAGLLVNFIGATFLVLYKSTMEQSKEYVAILERINAVGMSVHVLEKIDGGSVELKNSTTAKLSMKLLSMYHSTVERHSGASEKKSSRARTGVPPKHSG